jgi:hypothetical protein
MVADSETTIFDVGANGGIDAAAFDYLERLVPTDLLAVIDRLLARSRIERSRDAADAFASWVSAVCVKR